MPTHWTTMTSMNDLIKKVIFLDVDGVLNSEQSAVMHFIAKNVEWAPYDDFCFNSVAMLCHILTKHEDCKLVISSTWRKKYKDDPSELVQMFDPLPENFKKIIQPRIIGRTSSIYKEIEQGLEAFSREVQRGFEIQEWINRNKYRLDKDFKFVILDDDSDMGYLHFHHIKTNWRIGLTIMDANKAIARLKPMKDKIFEEAKDTLLNVYRNTYGFTQQTRETVEKLLNEIELTLKRELESEHNKKDDAKTTVG